MSLKRPYSLTVTIYGVKRTDENLFYLSSSLTSKFHDYQGKSKYAFTKDGKSPGGIVLFFNPALKIS